MKMPELPAEIEQLTEAVVGGFDCSDCYVAKKGGGFVLSENAKQQIAAYNDKLAAAEAEGVAKIAEKDEKIVSLEKATRDMAATGAIRSALVACGVKPKLVSTALPFLLKKLAVEIAEDGTATVNGASVESAVSAWLASPEAEPFAPKQPSAPGPLAQAVKAMR